MYIFLVRASEVSELDRELERLLAASLEECRRQGDDKKKLSRWIAVAKSLFVGFLHETTV